MTDCPVVSPSGRLALFVDSSGRMHARFRGEAASATHRIEALRSNIANLRVAPLGSHTLVLLELALFDCIHNLDDLRGAWNALARQRSWRGRVCIEWKAVDGVLQRRFLSDFTVLAAARIEGSASFETVIGAASDTLAASLARPTYHVTSLLEDAQLWAFSMLPPYLAFSTCGIRRMACLPGSALARESAGAPLAEPDDDLVQLDEDSGQCLGSQRVADLWGMIDRALECDDPSAARLRRHISRRLDSLWFGPVLTMGQALVLGWTIHLVAYGTEHTAPLRPWTAAYYVRLVVPALLKEIDEILSDGGERAVWVDLYKRILNAIPKKQRHKAHAALAAFHAYAEVSAEVPHLASIDSDGIGPEPPPRANIVTAAELEWAIEQLRGPRGPRRRFAEQAETVLLLVADLGGRINEYSSLRVQNVRIDPNGEVWLAIDPRHADGTLKTHAGRRPHLQLSDPHAVAALISWRTRRIKEGAAGTDLLFGGSYGTRRAMDWSRTVCMLLALLKCASGDRLVSLRTLRHSKVTRFAVQLPMSPEGERRFDRFSSRMGHETSETTRRHYDHSSDEVLRRVSTKLESDVKVSWSAAAQWLETSESALRKRFYRSQLACCDFLARMLAERVAKLATPDISSDFQFRERTAPEGPEDEEVGFAQVLSVCREIDSGANLKELVERGDGPAAEVRRIARRLVELAGLPWPIDGGDSAIRHRLDRALGRIGRWADFGRLAHPRYAQLVGFALYPSNMHVLLLAAAAWEENLSNGYVALDEPQRLVELLHFLAAAGVRGSQVIACISPGRMDEAQAASDLEQSIIERAVTCFGEPMSIRHRKARAGRPRAYLTLSMSDGPVAPASAGIRGLNALMLAASIWRYIREGSAP